MKDSPRLKVAMNLPSLILYGMGTMVGGGIYALIGKVAGEAGVASPLAFALASVLALLTGFTYAELVSRYPKSAGEAVYIDRAFGRPLFTKFIGWSVVAMGITSASALSSACAGFVADFGWDNDVLLTLASVLVLGGVAVWGISQSVFLVAIITLIEIGDLVFVLISCRDAFSALPEVWPEMISAMSTDPGLVGLLAGSFLAFYAYIGFEDMVNVVEEVESPRRTMPLAIIICVLSTFLLYAGISTVGALTLDPETLSSSRTPLAAILAGNGSDVSPYLMGSISLLAASNGALVQIIMSARVMYGMAADGNAPEWFGRINRRTRTPVNASCLAILAIVVLALTLELKGLASIASAMVLFVFTCVNAALIRIKAKSESEATFTCPNWVPWSGLIASGGLLLFALFRFVV